MLKEVTQPTRTARAGSSRAARPSSLADTLRLIPGYDPFETAKESWLDEDAAQQAIDFFHECLRHVEGAVAGQTFLLEPWQQAIIGNIFGWKRHDSSGRVVRRYREVFLYVPRKNGKTPLAAGICNYMLFCDGEPGAQIYSAAAEKEQATLLYRHAKGMIEQEPELAGRARIYRAHKSIVLNDDEASVYRVLSADADTKHGGNPHLVLIDELHAQPNRELVDVLETSMSSQNRSQPLLVHITTADFDRPSICNEKHDYASKVRDDVIVDEAFLPIIYEATADDDWTDPETWRKVNPNFGVSVSEDYLIRKCEKAKNEPTFENTFKRLHLNIRTKNEVRWIKPEAWSACGGPVDESALAGRKCYGAMDLSTKIDLSAFVLLFPPDDNDPLWRVLPRFWIPADNARERERRDRVPYETWVRQGFIQATPGNVIDYDFIKQQIKEDAVRFQVEEIAYDPWNATQIALQLQDDGATMVEFGQGFRSMSEPTKELEKLIAGKELAHGGHPVLKWMADNAAAEQDAAGNVKPSKRKSKDRIDGIVALVMSLGRALIRPEESEIEVRLI